MGGGRSNLPLDDILPPPAWDVIDDIREESDGDDETQHRNPTNFPTTTTGFKKFLQKFQ